VFTVYILKLLNTFFVTDKVCKCLEQLCPCWSRDSFICRDRSQDILQLESRQTVLCLLHLVRGDTLRIRSISNCHIDIWIYGASLTSIQRRSVTTPASMQRFSRQPETRQVRTSDARVYTCNHRVLVYKICTLMYTNIVETTK